MKSEGNERETQPTVRTRAGDQPKVQDCCAAEGQRHTQQHSDHRRNGRRQSRPRAEKKVSHSSAASEPNPKQIRRNGQNQVERSKLTRRKKSKPTTRQNGHSDPGHTAHQSNEDRRLTGGQELSGGVGEVVSQEINSLWRVWRGIHRRTAIKRQAQRTNG